MIAIALLGFVVIFSWTQSATAFPPSGGLVFVDPQNNHFSTSDMTVGSTFDINVKISNVTGIAGIEFILEWDPSLLNCTKITEVVFHQWTPVESWDNIWSIWLRKNNTGGYAEYAQLWQDNLIAVADGYAPGNITTTTNPPDGAQTVATLTMMVLKLPTLAEGSLSCPLNITLAIVGDLDGNAIIHSAHGIGNAPQSGTYTITYSPGDVHDVAVTEVNAAQWVFHGFNADIGVTVANNGDFDENVTVTLYYNITADQLIDTQNITISKGSNETIIFTWDTTGVPYPQNYTIAANATIPMDNNPGDNILNNGIIEVRIPGDITGDGIVNIMDAIQLGNNFGLQDGDARWDPRADLNRDGKVNLLDVIIVAQWFGRRGSI